MNRERRLLIFRINLSLHTGTASHYRSESQVNAWRMDFHGGRQPVQPVALRGVFHHEEAAVFEDDFYLFTGAFVLKGKLPFCTEGHGANGAVFFQIFFPVAVPGHAFTAVVVEV